MNSLERRQLLQELATIEGGATTAEPIGRSVFDGILPGMETRLDRGGTTAVGPDQDREQGEFCSKNSVASTHMLAGLA